MHPRPRGLTLVELLVVLAIVGVLAAILFPVFTRARESATTATCASNLKQIGLGMHLYLSDNSRRYPPHDVTRFIKSTCGWPPVLEPYVRSPKVFECPAKDVDDEYRSGCPDDEDDGKATRYFDGGYSLNSFQVPGIEGTSDFRVRNPSEMVLAIDGFGKWFTVQEVEHKKPVQMSLEYLFSVGAWALERHGSEDGESNNVLFADGHVKNLAPSALNSFRNWMVQPTRLR